MNDLLNLDRAEGPGEGPVTHRVEFRKSGRGKAQCPPDPQYPNGMAIDGREPGKPFCAVALAYPAPECGMWLINCITCGMSMAITAAGRPDDPVSVKIACLEHGEKVA